MQRKFFVSFIFVLLIASISHAEISREIVPLERNGYKLHLESLSTEKSTDPLLLIHGAGFSSHEFDVNYKDYSLARFFAKNGFKVWLLDITGFGRSQEVDDGFLPNANYAAEDIAAAAKIILEKNGRKSLDLLGWSWGTITSSKFAAKYPELVHRLVLYAPLVAGFGEKEITEPFFKFTWEITAGEFQRNADGSINSEITEPEVVNAYISNCWRYDKDSSPAAAERDVCFPTSERLLPTAELDMPVLLIAGAKDNYVSPELCREAFNTLKNKSSRLEIIEGGSHIVMLEKPYYKIFRQKILDFLRAN